MKKIIILSAIFLTTSLVHRAVAQGSLTPPGAPAPTMKTLAEIEPRTPISSLPFAISIPGSYYLTTNIVATNNQEGITINCSSVTLDLNGFALIGGGGSADGISFGNIATNCVIRNGVIQSWDGFGINGYSFGVDAPNMQVENVTVSGGLSGIAIGSGVIRDCVCDGYGSGAGFDVFVNGVLENCVAQNYNFGFNCGSASNVVVKSCSSFKNPTFGIYLGQNSLVSGCTVSGTLAGTAITLGYGSRAENCLVVSNNYGVYAQNNCVVKDCSFHSSALYCVQADNSTRIIDTLADGGNGAGIYLDGTNAVVDGCQVLNSLTGISSLTTSGASGNLIIRNSVRGCATPYSISTNTMTGPIISYGSGAASLTGVITNTSPWANFAY